MMAAHAMPAPVLKNHQRLLPLFVSLVIVCYLDRTALAFAALQLCEQDWFNAKVYGLGSGVFYAGYVVFQVPSNIILSKLGARTWLPVITAVWGAVAACCIFIQGPASFYALRLALGVAESGAFPAMWHTCGQFYPSNHITLAYSVIEASIAASQIIAAPLAAALLQLSGLWGLAGWQHLFLAEGMATMVLAVILRWRLPSSVMTADFLSAEDKLWLMQQLQSCGDALADAVTVGAPSGNSDCQSVPGQSLPSTIQTRPPAGSGTAHPNTGSWSGMDSSPRQQTAQSCELQPALGGQHSKRDKINAVAQQQQQQEQEQGRMQEHQTLTIKQQPMPAARQLLLTLQNKLLWYLMLLKALKDVALDGLVYFVPMLVHALLDGSTALSLHPTDSKSSNGKHCGSKESQLKAVLLTAVPFGTAAVAAVCLGHSSEVTGERRKHIGLPLLVGGCIFASLPLLLLLPSIVPGFLAVSAGVVAADATTGPFWTWVHLAAAPGTEAVSLAAVNSFGKAGGFLGPLSFGLVLHATGSYVPSILLVAAVLMLGGVLALCYMGERQHTLYTKLQDQSCRGATSSSLDSDATQHIMSYCGQQQQQQQRMWQAQHHSELELLRGSSGDSQYSSRGLQPSLQATREKVAL